MARNVLKFPTNSQMAEGVEATGGIGDVGLGFAWLQAAWAMGPEETQLALARADKLQRTHTLAHLRAVGPFLKDMVSAVEEVDRILTEQERRA